MIAEHLSEDGLCKIQEQAIAAVPIGVVICEHRENGALPIVYSNPAFERIAGYSDEECRNQDLRVLDGLASEPGARMEVDAAIHGGHDVDVLVRHYRKDGSVFWNEMKISPVRDAEGRINHWVVMVTDISNRKQAQERLERSEWLLSEAQALAQIGSFDWEVAKGTAVWSEEMYRVFGVTPGTEPTETTLRERLVPSDRAIFQELIGSQGSHSPHIITDLRIVLPSGAHRVVQLRGFAFRDADGCLLRMVGTVQDVTDERRRENALREGEALKAGIMDAALDAVITFDAEGRIVDCNLASEQIFARERDRLLQSNFQELFVRRSGVNGAAGTLLEPLHAGRSPALCQRMEVLGLCPNGTEFPVELTMCRVLFPEALLYTAFVRDLTERKRAEDAELERTKQVLNHQRSLLELASREKSDFPMALEAIIQTDSNIIQAERTSFWSLHGDSLYCEVMYRRGRDAWEFGLELQLTDYPVYFEALRANPMIAADDAQADPRTAEFAEDYLSPNRVTSLLDIPVWREGVLAGVICHEHVGPARTWTSEEQKFANSIGHLIALALAERERQNAEIALRESEERFRATFEQAAVGIGHVTLEGRFAWVNQRFCDILGYSRQALLARQQIDLNDPADSDVDLLGARQLITGKVEVYTAEHRYRRPDGSSIWINVSSSVKRDADGRPLYIIPVIQDISSRQQAEERVVQQASLLDLTHDAIIARDLNDRIVFWNRGAERLYHVEAARAIGEQENELLYRSTREFNAAKREVLEKGEWHGELRQRVPGGKEVLVDARWTLVRDESGEARSILAINTDITSRKALEEQFLRAQRMESIGTLASGVAHDLNNILAPILMAVPMLRSDVPEEIRTSLVSTIEASAQRGADIVRQVLTFARGVEGERVLLQVGHLLREMETIVQETFPKTITLRNRAPRNLWPVMGDATQIHQVLLNLCLNARDAMAEGGTLVIEAENFRMDESYAAMTPQAHEGPWVIMKVSDSGCGIERQDVEKIFDPFFTTKDPGKGTGLGLSTVVGIVRSHGGFINVSSEAGRGTTFQVYLPAVVDGVLEHQPEVVEEMPGGDGEIILVVDDEAGVREVTEAVLRRHNYRVLLAADGTEGLALYAKRSAEISVVLTDVVMPFIDGVALTRALKRLDPNVKVIVSTGHAQHNRMAELKSLGVEGFLLKPFSAESLLQAVRSALPASTE